MLNCAVLYPPVLDWDFMFQRPQQLLRALGRKGVRVVYINKSCGNHMREVDENVCLYPADVEISGVIRTLSHPWVLYVTNPEHFTWVDLYHPDLVIYDVVDWFPHWQQYDYQMLQRADMVFTVSRRLYEAKRHLHRAVYWLPNGVDVDHFNRDLGQFPGDLPSDKPIVGYSGALAHWVDSRILDVCIASRRKYNFVFIGTYYGMWVRLLPNVFILGHKPYDQLPDYVRRFSVGVIPFVKNEITEAADPIKFYEYCAAGIPVVSTDVGDVELYRGVTTICDSPEEFLQAIDRAVDDRNSSRVAQQLEIARANSWEARARDIYLLLCDSLL